VDLEAFELVLLRRPASAPDYPGEEQERIQREHLAYHAGLREAGHVVTNGPVDGQPDPSLRGLVFYRTGVAGAVPAARRGRPGGAGRAAGRRDHDVVLPARHDEPARPRRHAALSSAPGP
jgi:hypothetical protein